MKLYDELADWWALLSPPFEYADEAESYERLILDTGTSPCRTLLELGSGGGNNASYLKRRFDMVLVDRSPGMLQQSRALNPECEHVEGDMRTIRLGRQFDAVFLHDAVMYMATPDDLQRALETVAVHCRSGGTALIAPDFVRETFRPSTEHGGYDDPDGRGLRYLAWTRDPDPHDTSYLVEYAYLLHHRDGSVEVVQDRHVEGLFARDEWLRWLRDAGFDAKVIPCDVAGVEPGQYEIFVCRKRDERSRTSCDVM